MNWHHGQATSIYLGLYGPASLSMLVRGVLGGRGEGQKRDWQAATTVAAGAAVAGLMLVAIARKIPSWRGRKVAFVTCRMRRQMCAAAGRLKRTSATDGDDCKDTHSLAKCRNLGVMMMMRPSRRPEMR